MSRRPLRKNCCRSIRPRRGQSRPFRHSADPFAIFAWQCFQWNWRCSGCNAGFAANRKGNGLARGGVFLASKLLPSNASRAGTIAACERSLRRLKTDWLDLYLLHWPGSFPLEDTLEAFAELHRRGLIREFGVSNFDVGELTRAVAIAGEGRIACNQLLYHLEERAIEHEVMPWCKRHRIAVVGYSPFGSGNFPAPSSDGGRVLSDIARAHRATPRQVALRFLVRDENGFAIPMTSRPEHAVENAAAAGLRLTAEEVRRIDANFPRRARRRGLPML